MIVLLIIVAILAVAALAGWGLTLFAMTRGILWMVNADSVAERADARIEARISNVLARLRPASNSADSAFMQAAKKKAETLGVVFPDAPAQVPGSIDEQPPAVEG